MTVRAACWALRVEREGEHGTKVVPFPADCDECPRDDRQMWGCGIHGYEGKADVRYGEDWPEPFSRTCPQYYRRIPWVQQILMDLEDYRRGSLGNVMLLEAPYLQLLRIADVEQSNWQQAQERSLLESR